MAQLDSQKIEKLLSSATNERQRKIYQSLLKKARSQEGAAKPSSATETKVKAQAILGKVEKQEQADSEKKSSKTQDKSENKPGKTAKKQETKKQTKKKKLQEEAPIFQALGRMVLTPYLEDKDLKVEIDGQEYDLLDCCDLSKPSSNKALKHGCA